MTTTSPLRLATDGACSPNPGPGGWAWVAEDGRYEAGAFVHGTNNIGELLAIRHALLAHPDHALVIEYDSQYAVNCVTVWGPGWRRRGVTGKSNQALIYDIIGILERRTQPVEWQWVKGHDKTNAHPLNTAVDKIASSMSALQATHRECGTTDIIGLAHPKEQS